MSDMEKLLDELTVKYMLECGGFKHVGDWPLEWDASREDSQYTLNRDTIAWVVDALEKRGKIKKK